MDRFCLGLRLLVKNALRDERGAAAVEWSVLAALIAAVIVVVLSGMGLNLQVLFARAVDAIGVFM
ncbi:MAG: Flp/Fap pilin component [Rhodocyclaceae bacterium]|nr:Flp/Fap pilin component [Rhodocyclaceae bacterium]